MSVGWDLFMSLDSFLICRLEPLRALFLSPCNASIKLKSLALTANTPLYCGIAVHLPTLSSALQPETSSFTPNFVVWFCLFILFYCEVFKDKNLVYFFSLEKKNVYCLTMPDIWPLCISTYPSISKHPCRLKWIKYLCLDDTFTYNFDFNIYQFFIAKIISDIQIGLIENWIVHCPFFFLGWVL